jgi:hypothetical protein
MEYEFRYTMDGGKMVKQMREITFLKGGEMEYGAWKNLISDHVDNGNNNDRCQDTVDMFPNDGAVK